MTRLARGFTLIEAMTVLAITGVLLALAAPSFSNIIDKYKLRGAVESLVSDLQNARLEATKRNAAIYFSIASISANSWCYGYGSDSACDCTSNDTTLCNIRRVSTATDSSFSGTSLSWDGLSAPRMFDPTMGRFSGSGSSTTCSPSTGCSGKATFSRTLTGSVEIQISALGRVRACAPSSGNTGFESCQNN